MKKHFTEPNMISDSRSFIKKYPLFTAGLFIWFALAAFFAGTLFSKVSEWEQNKKITYKVGYCLTYIGGQRDTIKYDFKAKNNEPFESYLQLNSNGCVSNTGNVIIACGVRKVEWLYTKTYHNITKK